MRNAKMPDQCRTPGFLRRSLAGFGGECPNPSESEGGASISHQKIPVWIPEAQLRHHKKPMLKVLFFADKSKYGGQSLPLQRDNDGNDMTKWSNNPNKSFL